MLKKVKLANREYVIRDLSWNDVKSLCTFVNKLSREDTYVMLSGEIVTLDEEIDYVANSLSLMKKNKKIHLVVERNGMIVGNAEVRPNEKRKKHVGTVTIAIARSERGKGLGTELLRYLIKESSSSGLRMLTLSTMDINIAGKIVYERLGFKEIGTIPQAFLYKGKYIGETFYYLFLKK